MIKIASFLNNAGNPGSSMKNEFKLGMDWFERFKKNNNKKIEFHFDRDSNLWLGYVGSKHVLTFNPKKGLVFTDLSLSQIKESKND